MFDKMLPQLSNIIIEITLIIVAIVVSFFICWSPFHAQRVIIANISVESIDPAITQIFIKITYISGVTYYLTATINPILYQLMSLKFRLAFKDTFGIWFPCLKPRKMPEFLYSTAGGGNNANSEYGLERASSMKRQHRVVSTRKQNKSNGEAIRHSASFHHFPQATGTRKCHNLSPTINQTFVELNTYGNNMWVSCGETNSPTSKSDRIVIELNDSYSDDKCEENNATSPVKENFLNVPSTTV
ncbi:7 transmembrane receptor (rhodopsin family)-like protein 16 [Dinothrombium tinctorium]|uniref:7 transmembrane receptor (Rhodopsin family)-like protein 16 n=1 Tax=Dinothrombium tinctorium TaxID=1965070 RepID=A0A3S4REG3_9ACAR|nr:7 transmembrane receptor (rhodopsin family)-like protein 16 [Dinothrombium tinctorium]